MTRFSIIILLNFIYLPILAQWQPDTIILKKPYHQIQLKPGVKTSTTPLYSIKNYNIQQGLPNSYISSVITDHKGYLWFGSSGGGCGRFNGDKFEIFTEADGLPSNYIQKVFEDKKGRIWVGTYGQGIGLYENNRWKIYNDSSGFPGKYVWDITEDVKGNIWFAMERKGACVYDGRNFKLYTPEDGLCSPNIRCVYTDSKGKIWFGSDGKGLSTFKNNTFETITTIEGLPNNRVVSITEWKGEIWIGTYGGGICKYSNGKFEVFDESDGLANNLISSFSLGKSGRLLIATSGGGVSVFDGKQFKNYSTLNGFSNDVALTTCEDSYGNIWAGTYGGGISVIKNNSFVSYNEAAGLPVNVVKCFTQDNNGVWLGYSGAGIGLFRNDTLYNYSEKEGIPSNYVLAMTKALNNSWWAGTSGSGILHYENGKFTSITNWHGLPGNYILSLFNDSKQRLWIGTYGTGVGFLRNDTIMWLKPCKEFHPEYINCFAEISDSVFIATDNGLYCYVGQTAIEIVLPEAVGKKIKTLLVDDKKRLWLGTTGSGLWVKSGNSFAKLSTSVIPAATHIESLFQTPDGSIIAGLWKGIMKFIPESRNNNLKSLPGFLDFRVKYYDDASGYNGFNSLSNSYLCDNQNRIWMGTGQLLVRFDTEPAPYNEQTPGIELKEIKKQFLTVDWKNLIDSNFVTADSISLAGLPNNPSFSYDFNHLTFCLTAINLNNHNSTRIIHRLKGLEKDFSPPSDVYEITYTNIPPGDYCLEVYTYNENGIQSPEPLTYSFNIQKPWWETWWFRILCISFLVISLFVMYSLRISVLKKRQKLLEQKIDEATTEIRDKNDELQQQNEEILAQRDEIKSQRDEIEAQRDLVTEQKTHIESIHKDLTDSINYAERIQRSFLVSDHYLAQNLSSHFILFKPKDVVSGDFYWAKTLNNGHFAFVTADCTGHGVPGSIMSILIITALEKVVEQGMCEPAEILNATRNIIIERLKKDGSPEGGKDGMDASFISFDLVSKTLTYAAANNPVWIIRNAELIELQPDKMPVGKHDKDSISFNQHTIPLQCEDIVIALTDGFPDQFGGPAGKKFKYKPLKEILLSNSHLPMPQMKDILETTFNQWKGNLEQVDDVTIMGIKI